jgi:hypothetical protein
VAEQLLASPLEQVSSIYSVDDRMISECEAVGGM